MSDFKNIPEELRILSQWVVWKFEDIGAKKPTKIPHCPLTGRMASVSDPTTWSNFDNCCARYVSGGYDGIGFVLTDGDAYAVIDLDAIDDDKLSDSEKQIINDRQLSVFKEFDSYSEISPSGKGLHVIIKGSIKAGRKRSFIEVYSSKRYITMTGNIYLNKPISYQQDKLSQLWDQMAAGGIANYIYQGDERETLTDEDVIARATQAVNGDKFARLHNGHWNDFYSSQSEGDLAYINIIAYYTQNKNQITRIFRSSGLGQRKKAHREDYVSWMINKSFDRMTPQIDLDGFKNVLEEHLAKQQELPLGSSQDGKALDFGSSIAGSSPASLANSNGSVAQRLVPTAHNGSDVGSNPTASTTLKNKIQGKVIPNLNPVGPLPERNTQIPLPPGLMGEIAQFIYQVAPRQVPEIALAGAIGLMAGICGRAYNVSGSGLNQYILLLAKTGLGKEAMSSGIDKLISTVKMQVPNVNEFIGPSHIASGQALVKYIHKKSQCFVSILGEFGLRLQGMSSDNASVHERNLKQILLEVYQKSGHTNVFRASIHADIDKNTEITQSPAFSLLGESVPSNFYDNLSEQMISEGLLPRFLIIEYNGDRKDLNENRDAMPPMWLVDKLASLAANALTLMHSKRVINVLLNDEAAVTARDFDKFATNKINDTQNEVTLNLWNRAHLKALKLAALVAVGVNMSDPIITQDILIWSINIVQNDIKTLLLKFEKGEVGLNVSENRQQMDMVRIIREYIYGDWDKISKYKQKRQLFDAKIIPYDFLSKRLISQTSFKNDRMGATNAIKRTLQVMIDSDLLREVGKQELQVKFGTGQRAFIVSDTKILDRE